MKLGPKAAVLGGKAATIAGLDRTTTAVGVSLGRKIDHGEMRMIEVAELEIDPENPRQPDLTWELVSRQVAPKNPRQEHLIEGIEQLAESIRTSSQLQAMQVYGLSKNAHRIIEGERRYWALRLAERKHALCEWFPSKPDNLVTRRTVVNLERENYDVVAVMTSIRQHEEAFRAASGRGFETMEELGSTLGLKKNRAFLFWKLYRAEPEMQEKVLSEGHSSIDKAVEALTVATKAQEPAPAPVARKPRKGRARTAVTLGVVKEEAARTLIAKLDPKADLGSVAAGDYDGLQDLWTKTLRKAAGSGG